MAYTHQRAEALWAEIRGDSLWDWWLASTGPPSNTPTRPCPWGSLDGSLHGAARKVAEDRLRAAYEHWLDRLPRAAQEEVEFFRRAHPPSEVTLGRVVAARASGRSYLHLLYYDLSCHGWGLTAESVKGVDDAK